MIPRVLRLPALLTFFAGVSVVHAQTTAPSVTELIKQASRPGSSAARLPLAPATSDLFRGIDSLEPVGSGHVPNYLRAMALIPGAVGPYATAFKALIYGGTVGSASCWRGACTPKNFSNATAAWPTNICNPSIVARPRCRAAASSGVSSGE